jgi:hypothetical protein
MGGAVDAMNGSAAGPGSAEAGPATFGDMRLTDEELQLLARVVSVLRRVRYGTVALVIHDGRVMQMETEEKFRLR